MKTVAVLQARMGSTRLPGKVMADLAGKPLLAHVIERAQAIAGVDRVLVATTTADRDRPVLAVARECGADAFAGSEEDVLDRYCQAARSVQAEIVVRLTGDCPLLDSEVSARVLARFGEGNMDYVCNTLPPTFPDGLDTEAFTREALEEAWRKASLASEREHVTPYIWKNPDRFRIANVANPVDLSGLRWTVDEPRDLEFVRRVYARLYREGNALFGLKEVLNLLEREPEIRAVNAGLQRNEGYAKSLREDRTVQ